MGGGTTRLGAGLTLLVVIWVLVYWWYEPAAPSVTFAAPPDAASHPAEPPPVEPGPGPAGAAPEPAVVEPRFELYTIRKDDTAASISRRFFGTTAHAGAIARANPLMDIDRLRPGRTIRVPVDPSNIQGSVVMVEKPVEPAPEPVKADPVEPPAPPAATEYAVQPGDSLARISRRLYGSERYIDLIFNANRDRLRDKDEVREGQKLRIPPKPAGPGGG
ncbi:MAG: LysM peptidoglycan-binding domain-containing protein [Phycisphaerae bacterium]|nr:LysM peptidoglycan-binding domain-containing protein [Phycisphaerae bacterium]